MGRSCVALFLALPGCDCSGVAPAHSADAGCDAGACASDEDASICEETPSAEGCPCDRGAAPEKCFTGPAEAIGVGRCARGVRRCLADGWSECFGEIVPRFEWCNGMDDDCDGIVDDDCGRCEAPCEYQIDEDDGDASGARVVVDAQGVATVAWIDDGVTVSGRRQVGGVWSPIENFGLGDTIRLTGNDEGAVVLVELGGGWTVRFRDEGWTDRTGGLSDPTEIAMDPAGTAHAATRFGHYTAFVGGVWQGDADGPSHAALPRVAVGISGDVIAAWSAADGPWAWSPELDAPLAVPIGAEPISGVHALAVGMDDAGTAVAAWLDALDGLWVASRPARSPWSAPEEIARTIGANELALAVARGGAFTIVWTDATSVLASVLEPEGEWSEPARLDVGTRLGVGLDVEPCGDGILATWARAEGAASRIRASSWTGTWGPAFDVSTEDRWDAQRPDVDCTPDGEAVFVWEQRAGDSLGIRSVRVGG